MSGRLVLVRHGQSHANVERRLDTRPPGAALTDLGRNQARTFARRAASTTRPGLLAHSAAVRAELLERYDLELGGGVGPYADSLWRIGLMGPNASDDAVALVLAALADVLGR